MAHMCLLLSGAALLVNGLATLDRLPRRDAAVFSLVVGSAPAGARRRYHVRDRRVRARRRC